MHSSYSQTFDFKAFLDSNAASLGVVWSNPDKHEVQIIYTQIDRDQDQKPTFTSYEYGVDPDKYFYPASTIKMPLALLSLEKLAGLHIEGLNRKSRMYHQAARSPQSASYPIDTVFGSEPTMEQYIRKLFCVSDNESSNRLYEFLGQKYIYDHLAAKGAHHNRIVHRLAAGQYNQEDNRWMNPVGFKQLQSEGWLYFQGEVYSARPEVNWKPGPQLKGRGHINSNGDLVNLPFDFSTRNAFGLRDLHDIVKGLFFDQHGISFNLHAADRKFIQWCMGSYPRENNIKEQDTYVKYFIFDSENGQIPSNVRIFNKVGWSYGYLTDISYIVDFENGVEFVLAATVYVNENEIFNDNQYEYQSVGLPFLRELGATIYNREINRKRNVAPDLNQLKELFENSEYILNTAE
jgi:hypothetical protein